MINIKNKEIKIVLIVLLIGYIVMVSLHSETEFSLGDYYYNNYLRLNRVEITENYIVTNRLPYVDIGFYLLPIISLSFLGTLMFKSIREIMYSKSKVIFSVSIVLTLIAMFQIINLDIIERSTSPGILNISLGDYRSFYLISFNVLIMLGAIGYSIVNKDYNLIASFFIGLLYIVTMFYTETRLIHWFGAMVYGVGIIATSVMIITDNIITIETPLNNQKPQSPWDQIKT